MLRWSLSLLALGTLLIVTPPLLAQTYSAEDETLWKKLNFKSDDSFLDDEEQEEGKWTRYDTNKNGYVEKTEFMAGRAQDRLGDDEPPAPTKKTKTISAKPTPRKATVPRKTTAAQPTATKTVRLPSLKPRRGYIIGRAVFADGRPIPSFTIEALGFTGKLHLGPTGTLPFLGDDKATNGRYAIQTRDYAYTKAPVNSLVTAMKGLAYLTYRGQKYSLKLHPIDGKPDGTSTGGFNEQSGKGIVRDFVLKMSGVRIGYEQFKTPEVSVEDDGTMMNSFYGGTVDVSTSYGNGGREESANPAGSVITVTFTPVGKLMDGSPAQTVTRSHRFVGNGLQSNFVIRNIPLGSYTATATLTDPTGNTMSLSFKDKYPKTGATASQLIEFAPYSFGFFGRGGTGLHYADKMTIVGFVRSIGVETDNDHNIAFASTAPVDGEMTYNYVSNSPTIFTDSSGTRRARRLLHHLLACAKSGTASYFIIKRRNKP